MRSLPGHFILLALAAVLYGLWAAFSPASPTAIDPAKPPVVVFAGDSHIDGYLDHKNSLPTLLRGCPEFGRVQFVNAGQSGRGWKGVYKHYALEALPHAPKFTHARAVFYLHVGSNDIDHGETGDAEARNVAKIIERAKADGFIVVAALPWGDPAITVAKSNEMGLYRSLLLQNRNVSAFVDANILFPHPSTGDEFLSGSNHLAPPGQRRYAETVRPVIRRLLFP